MNNFYDIWFSTINISNENKIKLLDYFKNASNIWNSTKEDYIFGGMTEKIFQKISNSKSTCKIDKYLEYMEQKKIKLICYTEKNYPYLLNQIDNKPVYIYVRGNINNLYQDNVAIVGSRNATQYGKDVARKISKELADRSINIVSGLALGIDKYAHLGALDSKIGKTIAVLGTGVSDSEVYPYENKKVFERILEEGGTIVSEFCLGTKPQKYNFPLRNRIISGLAKKIIVVEASFNSGSFITVNYALNQGKDIYAIPRKHYF